MAAHITFPDCMIPGELDSANHRSHMRYSRAGHCPRSHPRPVPRLVLQISWPRTAMPVAVTLASGPATTLHADLWNTWHQPRLRRLVNQCLETEIACGLVT